MRCVSLAIVLLAAAPSPTIAASDELEKTIDAKFFERMAKLSDQVSGVSHRLYGRMLGSMVREGMTADEVDSIFGPNVARDGTTFLNASGITRWLTYPSLGVHVSFSNYMRKDLRVTEVKFAPLFK